MTQFNVGETLSNQQPFNIDVENIVAGRTFIASITRWGKSKTVRKMLEACFGHTGIIIIDPEGEWSSLREKFPFLIIGKDVPLQLETAQAMAELVLARGLSVIIDTSMVEDEEESKEYVNAFLRRFFFIETTQKQSYLIVVEEAEDFVPERGISTQTCLGVFINIVKKGGKRGIGALFIAHRPAWVSKGILSQCRNKAFSAIESTDFEAIEQVARVPHNVVEKLPTLKPGQFYFVGDWVNQPEFVQVNKQTLTTHLGDSPGLKYVVPNAEGLAEVIKGLQANLKEVVEKVTPTMPDVDAIRKEAEAKATTAADERLKKETAKLETQYKQRIENLEADKKERDTRIESLSRQASMSSVPLSNVFDHPIVQNRIKELSPRAKDLLTKVEGEPNLDREVLAAFLHASKDTVKSVVDEVNRVFKAQVIIDDGGRPVRYRSMLKRLFLTDVARREIDELQRLQNLCNNQGQLIGQLKTEKQVAFNENQQLIQQLKNAPTPEAYEKLKTEIKTKEQLLKDANTTINQSEKALAFYQKTINQLSEILEGANSFKKPITQSAVIIEQIPVQEAPKPQPIEQPIIAAPSPVIPQPTANIDQQKILGFLKTHQGTEFTAFELSISLGLSEQIICESTRNISEITVSPNGLSIRR